ncbi:MAG: sodium:calcium antiporter, partial [Acidimicrobiales bacterium]
YEGFILLGMLIISLWLILRDGRKGRSNIAASSQEPLTQSQRTETRAQILDGLVIVVSLVGVIGSSYFITEGAIGLAEKWGVGSGFVGASLVAIGTSLPELVASIVALRKGKSEIIIGTILGSNVFNGVAIGAAIGILGPGEMIDAKIIGWLSALTILLAAATWCLKSLSPKPVGKLVGFMLLSIYVFWLVVVGI